jgi:hypothetical protein
MMSTMTPAEYVKLVSDRLRKDGAAVGTVDVGGFSALTGYRSQFRIAWMATRLHLFVVVAEVPTVTLDALTGFSDAVLD